MDFLDGTLKRSALASGPDGVPYSGHVKCMVTSNHVTKVLFGMEVP